MVTMILKWSGTNDKDVYNNVCLLEEKVNELCFWTSTLDPLSPGSAPDGRKYSRGLRVL